MIVAAMALCALGAGVLATWRAPGPDRASDVAAGAALGLAVFLWLPYLLARWCGLEGGAWLAFGFLALAAAAGVARTAAGGPVRPTFGAAPRWPGLLVVAVVAFLAWLLYRSCPRLVDGKLLSSGGGCEDMGMHATLAHAFLRSQEQIVHPAYPIFDGWPLGYPFLPDFSAAVGMALGASAGAAFFATGALALVALVAAAWAFARRFLASPAAALAILLLLFGGNLGFVFFLRDLAHQGWWQVWLNDYVANWNLSLHYGNTATTILIPMRTSLFGAPMAFAVMAILARRGAPTPADRIVTGALHGSLPLVNGHAFLVTSLYVAAHLAPDPVARVRRWWPALALAAALALPQLLWIHRQTAASATPFGRLANGFLFDTPLSWPTYWLVNGGLFVPLAFAAWWAAPRSLRAATLPLLLLLPLAITVYFQPNPYDNVKLLLFFQLGAAVLIADLCRRAVARGWATAALAALALVVCTASGVLAWIREANIPCEMATPDDLAFADVVLRETDVDSVVLTGQHYTHPVPFLAGRTIVLGFHNWLGQHGIPFTDRVRDVRAIYTGAPDAGELLGRYRITHIVVGPIERREFPDLDEGAIARLAGSAPVTSGPYALYRVAAVTPP